jgi:hypothetical protein
MLQPTDAALINDEDIFFNTKNYDFLMKTFPSTKSQVFITDTPSGSGYNLTGGQGKEWVDLSSLEFKTCLYHIKDVPMVGAPASFNVSEKVLIGQIKWQLIIKRKTLNELKN